MFAVGLVVLLGGLVDVGEFVCCLDELVVVWLLISDVCVVVLGFCLLIWCLL